MAVGLREVPPLRVRQRSTAGTGLGNGDQAHPGELQPKGKKMPKPFRTGGSFRSFCRRLGMARWIKKRQPRPMGTRPTQSTYYGVATYYYKCSLLGVPDTDAKCQWFQYSILVGGALRQAIRRARRATVGMTCSGWTAILLQQRGVRGK